MLLSLGRTAFAKCAMKQDFGRGGAKWAAVPRVPEAGLG
jgi:hypothetical protein